MLLRSCGTRCGTSSKENLLLEANCVPTKFSFHSTPTPWPSHDVRRAMARERGRAPAYKSLPVFGPLTLTKSLQEALDERSVRIAEQKSSIEVLKAENRLLKSQHLQYNIAGNPKQMENRRAIGRVRQHFHILDGEIPITMAGSINQIWSVCCILSNLFSPLIRDAV